MQDAISIAFRIGTTKIYRMYTYIKMKGVAEMSSVRRLSFVIRSI